MPTAIRSKNNKTDIHMKHAFTKGLFVAATATLIAACSTDDAADQMPVAPGKIEVSLKAALPQSRAQIEVDESNGRFSGFVGGDRRADGLRQRQPDGRRDPEIHLRRLLEGIQRPADQRHAGLDLPGRLPCRRRYAVNIRSVRSVLRRAAISTAPTIPSCRYP